MNLKSIQIVESFLIEIPYVLMIFDISDIKMLSLSRRLCLRTLRMPVNSVAMSTDNKLIQEPNKIDQTLKYQVNLF